MNSVIHASPSAIAAAVAAWWSDWFGDGRLLQLAETADSTVCELLEYPGLAIMQAPGELLDRQPRNFEVESPADMKSLDQAIEAVEHGS